MFGNVYIKTFLDMMKKKKEIGSHKYEKIIGLLLACFLAVPTVSFAHTHVQTTVPENGATVTAPLKEIKLTFETHIEKISTVTVTKDGQKFHLHRKSRGS
ncbi:copper resistance protein CopC [Priestia megaterium]